MKRSLALLVLMIAAIDMAATPREVAVTFDDLPDLNASEHSLKQMQEITRKLVASVRREGVPATGFVNEDKLRAENERTDSARLALLSAWLDAGLELGNHTWSHLDLHATSIADYQSDIIRGEELTRPLCDAHHSPLTWFRHPYLNTGASLPDRDSVDNFLAGHGYKVAPVTIDDSEWIFDLAYDRVPARRQFLTRGRIGRAYIRYMAARFDFAERMSRRVFAREIPQVLLLHASQLNADYFPRLARMMRRRGYRFVSLDAATRDRAYAAPNSWTGGGVGWIERWGATAGMAEAVFEDDPKVPLWVQQLAQVQE